MTLAPSFFTYSEKALAMKAIQLTAPSLTAFRQTELPDPKAGPGEVLVSGVTRELLAGSGLRFESRGQHALKGIDGERELFALESA